jgi:two-component system chemotaxis response regulator CheY
MDVRRVLLVDDSAVVCRMVETLLRTIGFEQIEVAHDGSPAPERLQASRFEIISCDWEMEPINGLEVLRQVRGRQETKSVPLVLMSARKDPQWVSAAMEAGADCLIAKPFGAATLKAKIHQIGHAGRSGGIRERVLA